MSGFLADFLTGVFAPFFWMAMLVLVIQRWRRLFALAWAVSAVGDTVFDLIAGWRGDACGSAVSFVLALILWWFNRRRRNRAKQLIGAKSRAIRDALVRRMRELAPRPVLQPVPQGAS